MLFFLQEVIKQCKIFSKKNILFLIFIILVIYYDAESNETLAYLMMMT